MNPYFDLEKPTVIQSIEDLMLLNVEKLYYKPGDEDGSLNGMFDTVTSSVSFIMPLSTSGIFRGQIRNWPLVPNCFRGFETKADDPTPSDFQISLKFSSALKEFNEFCERAEIQNFDFPLDISSRLSIAQHFGVKTPLLDWSKSIFTAIFFAIRDVWSDKQFAIEDKYNVYIYHIIDERYLHAGIPVEDKLPTFAQSAFIKSSYFDRRIEKQRGVFTYHPHPILTSPKIPVKVYVLEWNIIANLIKLMKGFGFTEDYFFPDYAGIANAVKTETSL